ncbi:MarR family winged helix-turn-helix transcriptional regulator [Tenacibaculum sp. 190524A02b]|uniref:MarR family winged helix-turn-helix transcriptional regulator n=1 Tax=Tenacibaculum vairaonense TaxID=3137860 RepID=UPI0031FB7807
MKHDLILKFREFNRYYTKVIGLTNNHILDSKYSLSEVRVMYEIYHTPNITARKIKEIIQVDEGYLSRLIKKLVNQNLIIKTKSKKDNRVSSLKLSENGVKVFLELNDRSSRAMENVVKHLNENEQNELILMLEKIKNLLGKDGFK